MQCSARWREKGWGVWLGSWKGNPFAKSMWTDTFGHLFPNQTLEDLCVSIVAFMDDIYLLAATLAQLQCMLNDLIHEPKVLGLSL